VKTPKFSTFITPSFHASYFLDLPLGPYPRNTYTSQEVTPKLKLNFSLLSAISLHNCLTHTFAPTLMISMRSGDFTENESVLGSGEMWSTPTTQCKPWDMHNRDAQSYSIVSYSGPSSVSFQQIPSEKISRPGSMDQDLYPPTTTDDCR
jgi:hypothetical protein